MSVRYRLSTGAGTWTNPFTGVIDLATPTLFPYGGGEFGVRYGLTGSFAVGGTTYSMTGVIPVHDQGAGLWDAGFSISVAASTGQHYQWESTTGAFFRADGTPFPSAMGTSSIAYSVFPERIEFAQSAFLQNSGLGQGMLIADRMCIEHGLDGAHLKTLDKKISDLSNALATLGRGTDLRELLMIIRNPGWTTPAELALVLSLLDSMQAQTKLLTDTSAKLLAASKLVAPAR